jgi:Cu2+-exporting ATPase
VAVPLAAGTFAWAGIVLPPAVGAILMSASTIVVAANAQLLRRLDLRPSPVAAGTDISSPPASQPVEVQEATPTR